MSEDWLRDTRRSYDADALDEQEFIRHMVQCTFIAQAAKAGSLNEAANATVAIASDGLASCGLVTGPSRHSKS